MKNIIFDLDGTLIDSMPIWDNIGRDFLIKKGAVPPENLDEILERLSLEEGAQYFIDKLGVKMSVKEILDEIVKMVEEKYIYEVPLKAGAYEFLEKMKRQGVKMCLLTASEESYVYPALERLGIKKFFENIFTCTSLGMSKSGSEIYEYTAQKCGFHKNETAVFEDALHGVKNAKAAGFFVYGIYDSHEEKNKEEVIKTADVYVESFEQLI